MYKSKTNQTQIDLNCFVIQVLNDYKTLFEASRFAFNFIQLANQSCNLEIFIKILQNNFIIYRESSFIQRLIIIMMITKKIQWVDVSSDENQDQIQQTPQSKKDSQEIIVSTKNSLPQKKTISSKDREEKRRIRNQQKIQQLKKLDALQGDEVWLFVFLGNNPSGLEKCVQQLDCIRLKQNSSGWEVLVTRQQAKLLLINSFRQKKIFTKIQVANRNYNDEKRRDKPDRDEKKKYITKGSKRMQEIDGVVQNQFTFQKKKKSEKQSPQDAKCQTNHRQRQKQKMEKKQSRKQTYNIYKDNPLYQGLGDFRNKQLPRIQINNKEQVILQKQNSIKSPTLKKQSSNKPRYVQKQIKPQYKQKSQKSEKLTCQNLQYEFIPEPKQQIKKQESQIQVKNNQNIVSNNTILEQVLQITNIQNNAIKEQITSQLHSKDQSEKQEEEQQIECEQSKQQKPKKPRRKRNKDKDKDIKPVKISNNPFDRLK